MYAALDVNARFSIINSRFSTGTRSRTRNARCCCNAIRYERSRLVIRVVDRESNLPRYRSCRNLERFLPDSPKRRTRGRFDATVIRDSPSFNVPGVCHCLALDLVRSVDFVFASDENRTRKKGSLSKGPHSR